MPREKNEAQDKQSRDHRDRPAREGTDGRLDNDFMGNSSIRMTVGTMAMPFPLTPQLARSIEARSTKFFSLFPTNPAERWHEKSLFLSKSPL